MAQINFEFSPDDNVKSFPKPISGKYEMQQLVIEANSLIGLADAIRKMRIYFRFDFGSPAKCDTKIFNLSQYIFVTDELTNTIDFNDVVIEITSKHTCTSAIVSIQDNIETPVTKMILTLNQTSK